MLFTIAEIAEALGTEALGNASIEVSGAAEPADARADQLALAMKPEFSVAVSKGKARAALVWPGADWEALGLEAAVAAPRGRLAMSTVTRLLDRGPDIAEGIHPMAMIDPTAEIGPGAAIGPFVVIGRNARIGAGARIAAQVTIGAEARIGRDAVLLEGARIGARVVIGDRFIGQCNSVIGGDGFSFVTPETSNVEQARASLGSQMNVREQHWERIHSLGTVEIGDDVEVGANSTVDRGTIRATLIGRGTKLDNIVHVGHNCEIGEDCLLCGQVGLAGSVRVGNRVVLGGQVGVSDNIFIGDDVVAGGASVVLSNVPAGRMILGYPATKMDAFIDSSKHVRRLGRYARDIAALKKAVSNPGDSD